MESQLQLLQRKLAPLQEDANTRMLDLPHVEVDATLDGYSLDELKAMVQQGSLQCPVCSRTFGQLSELANRLKLHVAKEGKYKCPYCPAYAGQTPCEIRYPLSVSSIEADWIRVT